jgi:PelA/Pel-15E family pectate lyase
MKESNNTIMACPQASQGAGLSTIAPPKTKRGLPFPSLTQRFSLLVFFFAITSCSSAKQPVDSTAKKDFQADNMLVYQRAIGGWPKAVNEVKVEYTKTLTPDQALAIKNDSLHKDATIDNKATTREIEYLVTAYKKAGNPAYLQSAEKGIRYLLKAQYANGGWPQYYPDMSLYRHQITYNDDAMIHVLDLLQDVVEGKHDFEVVAASLKSQAAAAVQKGVDCILKTQVKQNGVLTAWAAQYDEKTFEPAKARAFELPSIASSESVGIIRFLMRQPAPSNEIKKAITAAVQWLDKVKIPEHNFVSQPDPSGPKGFDKKFVEDPASTVWARFYELGTDRPMFAGRDSQVKYNVSEIESERRNGYAWYGTWPQKLIDEQYPKWLQKTKDK